MSEYSIDDPILDMYIFETNQQIEQLESAVLESEKSGDYASDTINDIFRVMHTIKGSSAMMLFNNISLLAHAMEDLFYFIREEKPQDYDCSALSDLILEGVDFIKVELEKIKAGDSPDGEAENIISGIKGFLSVLKQGSPEAADTKEEVQPQEDKQQYYIPHEKNIVREYSCVYRAAVYFEDGCEMENIRAYTVVHNLEEVTDEMYYIPDDIMDNDSSSQTIRDNGFTVYFKANKSYEEMQEILSQTIFLKAIELEKIEEKAFEEHKMQKKDKTQLCGLAPENSPVTAIELQDKLNLEKPERENQSQASQGIISVNVLKLNKLMDLVGEMVVAEAMVTQNPDLKGLNLENFQKAARQLKKISGELQDMVMSIRMVPISGTFNKMHRIVRDMSKKLDKQISLEIIGEETEVDKNIIEHISDPLMHVVRNSIDHGIEATEDRVAAGKTATGTITIEARNAGSDVLIIVKDDGRGLNKEKILMRARENGLIKKPENLMTDKEIYSLIFLPGFSTKDRITEYSGRGVGMDVVTKNIEAIGGTAWVDSAPGEGSITTMKIPLTLAIIDGMNIRVGKSCYTIPTTDIRESFRPSEKDIIKDPDENEMIMVRGSCYPILRLHKIYNLVCDTTKFSEGVLIMVENQEKTLCIFADELLGEQQVVVKALPEYIRQFKKSRDLAGCTLLGDGNISLILDSGRLMN
ncbi:two-component system chemotaxis sensor kinase CheA [Ruminiclostridium sufflavum DSM 19573]|uniref:Chemotaxis protein CheA n=1 Tax=Ruminiclostridium sufflavum DSM 19573 TaxID=1121337 RepID=A0A318Y112_9FIRM|nr:chemotaxis protein CheA [Ruminiclostridium sufflavum]PYG84354.1 two-component system chemotaxis sensor kinase CheA [Ruminiclostridium sufflavum DSM 19573]